MFGSCLVVAFETSILTLQLGQYALDQWEDLIDEARDIGVNLPPKTDDLRAIIRGDFAPNHNRE